MLNFVVGWTDWNLWLNEFGGPNWVGNFVDAPIIVNRTKGSYSSEFYKQPSFYVLAHFSMFVVPGSVRLEVVDGYLPVEAVAFETPDGNIAVVLLNTNENTAFEFAIAETGTSNRYIHVQIEPKSIKTILLKKKKNVDNRTKKNF